jgi:hypothetical protein
MRTTVRLDEHILREAKEHAARTGQTLAAVIEDALRESLARHRARSRRPPVKLPTFKGKGLRPGVDLDDSAGLLELMDGSRDPA